MRSADRRGAAKGILLSLLPSAAFAAWLGLLSLDGTPASHDWTEESRTSLRLAIAASLCGGALGAALGVLAARLERRRLERLVVATWAGFWISAGVALLALPRDAWRSAAGSALAIVLFAGWTIVGYAVILGVPLMLAVWLLERWTRAPRDTAIQTRDASRVIDSSAD